MDVRELINQDYINLEAKLKQETQKLQADGLTHQNINNIIREMRYKFHEALN